MEVFQTIGILAVFLFVYIAIGFFIFAIAYMCILLLSIFVDYLKSRHEKKKYERRSKDDYYGV